MAPRVAVLAFPEFQPPDADWIQAQRRLYDPKTAARVAPHVTFVFPAPDEPGALAAHVRNAVAGVAPLSFILRSAKAVKDAFSALTHGFLVPEEGHEDMIRLYEKLHTGHVAARRRPDIPFIPHITAGAFDAAGDCARWVASVNVSKPAIAGVIRSLDVVAVEARIHTIERIALPGSQVS